MRMQTIVWDPRFVTGLNAIDEQHQQIVTMINEAAGLLLAEPGADWRTVQNLFKDLADYARQHFAEEEALMREVGVDGRHVEPHAAHHRLFVEQLQTLWRARDMMANPAEALHGFLAAWVTFHLLEEDQSMAGQIRRIRASETPAAAYDAEKHAVDNTTAVLLDALHQLYRLLCLQNQDLLEANTRLEQRVERRTTELRAANDRLAAEQGELTALLSKVEEAQGQLLQSEKMAAIGQLAAGIAHEINNPIGFVTSNLGTMRDYVQQLLALLDAYERQAPENELVAARAAAELDFVRTDIMELLKESADGLSRVRGIISALKDFAHVDQIAMQEADLNQGLESTLRVVWNELKYKVEVVRDYGDLPLVRCISAQINQVFMNLLVNAAQAIESRGVITVRTASDGTWAWVEVCDTGCGMTAEVQRRIFEPFYTTKPIGRGTGLGLSIAYDIVVKNHGGRLDVESTPGTGTTFRVVLPVAGPAVKESGNET
jgi:two-component system, NtrC family, sensor kinase